MRVVVDTNVLAYHLLGTSRFSTEAAGLLDAADELMAPALWEAEFGNVIWMACRSGVIANEQAPVKLSLAARLGIRSIATRELWQGALLRSLQSGVALYDTLFVELAEREQVKLATFDRRLVQAFPRIAMRPREIEA